MSERDMLCGDLRHEVIIVGGKNKDVFVGPFGDEAYAVQFIEAPENEAIMKSLDYTWDVRLMRLPVTDEDVERTKERMAHVMRPSPESILVSDAKMDAFISQFSPVSQTVPPSQRGNPRTDARGQFLVACIDEGRFFLATRKVFEVWGDAMKYIEDLPPSRQAIIIEAVKPI